MLPDIYECDGVTCVNDTDSDGICDELELEGCIYPTACNYNALATFGSTDLCTFPEAWRDCDGNCLLDADGDGACDRMTDYICDVGEMMVGLRTYSFDSRGYVLVEGGFLKIDQDIDNTEFVLTGEPLQGLAGTWLWEIDDNSDQIGSLAFGRQPCRPQS